MTPYQISLLLALNGLAQSAWLLIAFPAFQLRFGTGNILRVCGYIMTLTYFFTPVFNLLLRFGYDTAFWIITPIALSIICGVSMSYTGVQLALNDIAPSPTTLGTLNAIALAVTSGVRAVAPAVFTSIFAIGVDKQILWGYLIWVILSALSAMFAFVLHWLPAKAEGNLQARPEQESNIEEQD
jgi:hypothetical protein